MFCYRNVLAVTFDQLNWLDFFLTPNLWAVVYTRTGPCHGDISVVQAHLNVFITSVFSHKDTKYDLGFVLNWSSFCDGDQTLLKRLSLARWHQRASPWHTFAPVRFYLVFPCDECVLCKINFKTVMFFGVSEITSMYRSADEDLRDFLYQSFTV